MIKSNSLTPHINFITWINNQLSFEVPLTNFNFHSRIHDGKILCNLFNVVIGKNIISVNDVTYNISLIQNIKKFAEQMEILAGKNGFANDLIKSFQIDKPDNEILNNALHILWKFQTEYSETLGYLPVLFRNTKAPTTHNLTRRVSSQTQHLLNILYIQPSEKIEQSLIEWVLNIAQVKKDDDISISSLFHDGTIFCQFISHIIGREIDYYKGDFEGILAINIAIYFSHLIQLGINKKYFFDPQNVVQKKGNPIIIYHFMCVSMLLSNNKLLEFKPFSFKSYTRNRTEIESEETLINNINSYFESNNVIPIYRNIHIVNPTFDLQDGVIILKLLEIYQKQMNYNKFEKPERLDQMVNNLSMAFIEISNIIPSISEYSISDFLLRNSQQIVLLLNELIPIITKSIYTLNEKVKVLPFQVRNTKSLLTKSASFGRYDDSLHQPKSTQTPSTFIVVRRSNSLRKEKLIQSDNICENNEKSTMSHKHSSISTNIYSNLWFSFEKCISVEILRDMFFTYCIGFNAVGNYIKFLNDHLQFVQINQNDANLIINKAQEIYEKYLSGSTDLSFPVEQSICNEIFQSIESSNTSKDINDIFQPVVSLIHAELKQNYFEKWLQTLLKYTKTDLSALNSNEELFRNKFNSVLINSEIKLQMNTIILNQYRVRDDLLLLNSNLPDDLHEIHHLLQLLISNQQIFLYGLINIYSKSCKFESIAEFVDGHSAFFIMYSLLMNHYPELFITSFNSLKTNPQYASKIKESLTSKIFKKHQTTLAGMLIKPFEMVDSFYLLYQDLQYHITRRVEKSHYLRSSKSIYKVSLIIEQQKLSPHFISFLNLYNKFTKVCNANFINIFDKQRDVIAVEKCQVLNSTGVLVDGMIGLFKDIFIVSSETDDECYYCQQSKKQHLVFECPTNALKIELDSKSTTFMGNNKKVTCTCSSTILKKISESV
ncbi:hypothetical protein QTN25_005668 [Entamoeba marina]